MLFENILVGADPEVFVTKGTVLVSGHTFPCGTKEKPRLLASGGVQIDGMALEFNVKPSRTRVEFVSNVVRVYNDLNKIVKKQDKDASILVVPTANFGREYIDSMPEKVKELGCNPDYNGYTAQPNPTPDADRPFRTGAGHVHIGFTENAETDDAEHFATCCTLARQLDFYLGLPSLAWDSDNQRRELYGKAGAFRSKSYGMEYRTLSNAWVADKKLMAFVYDRTLDAVRALNEGQDLDKLYPGLAREVIDFNVLDWADRFPEIAHLQYGR